MPVEAVIRYRKNHARATAGQSFLPFFWMNPFLIRQIQEKMMISPTVFHENCFFLQNYAEDFSLRRGDGRFCRHPEKSVVRAGLHGRGEKLRTESGSRPEIGIMPVLNQFD